jgi:hypothetical protein
MTATCACTPTRPTTSLPAISRISDPAPSRGGAHYGAGMGVRLLLESLLASWPAPAPP